MTDLRSLADMARAAGRFEMHRSANQPNQIYKSMLDVESAEEIGLFAAETIYGMLPDEPKAAQMKLLDSMGEKDGKVWVINPPSDEGRVAWKRLLESDVVLCFYSAGASDWASRVVRNLYLPFVADEPLMSLEGDWRKFIKARMSGVDSAVSVSTGAKRAFYCISGVGSAFGSLVEVASERPPLMWGYPESALRSAARTRRLILPPAET